MFYGCWANRSYPKWFCRENFKLIRTVRKGGAMPSNISFYHWKREKEKDCFYSAESGDVILMFIHSETKPKKYFDSSEINLYETDVSFFRGWVGGCHYYDEISMKDWRELDKACFEIENPYCEY